MYRTKEWNYRPEPKRRLWVDVVVNLLSLAVLVWMTFAVVDHLAK
jgi:hypothetical protein